MSRPTRAARPVPLGWCIDGLHDKCPTRTATLSCVCLCHRGRTMPPWSKPEAHDAQVEFYGDCGWCGGAS